MTFRALAKSAIESVVPRERLVDSRPYHLYMRLFLPKSYSSYQDEFSFYRRLLDRSSLIFDVGASRGGKTDIFRRLSARCICIEPNPSAVRSLQTRFGHRKTVTIIPMGASAVAGEMRYYLIDDDGALNSFEPKHVRRFTATDHISVKVITLDSLIAQFGMPDYIKIDVEGHEISVLSGLSAPVNLVSFECNLPSFSEESIACIKRLIQLGSDYRFNFVSTTTPIAFDGEWISAATMTDIIVSCRFTYLEIFARRLRDR